MTEPPSLSTEAEPQAGLPARLNPFGNILAAAVLAFFVLWVYSNLSGAQLYFDSLQLAQDPSITRFEDAWYRFWSSGLRPGQQFTDLTFAASHAWNLRAGRAGFDAESFVRVNAKIHAVNSCLLFLLLLRLRIYGKVGRLFQPWMALIVSALFAAHPLHAASVMYVAQRRGLLVALFLLCSLHSYLSAIGTKRMGRSILWGVASAVSAILCAKSKTMGVLAPFAVLLFDLVLAYARGAALRRRLLVALGACGIISLAMLIEASRFGWFNWSKLQFTTPGESGGLDGMTQFATQMRAMAATLGLIALPLPSRLSLDHPFPISKTMFDGAVLGSLVLHAGALVLAVWLMRRRHVVTALGLFLFYFSYVPWLFIPQVEQLVEYKSYLGMIGLAIALTGVAAGFRPTPAKFAFAPLLLAAIMCCARVTIQRVDRLKSPITIWSDILANDPRHFRAQVSLGVAFADAGKFEQALTAFRKADQMQPYNAMLHYYMGNAERGLGHLPEAIEEYKEARRISGEDLHIAVNLGNAQAAMGMLTDAIETYRSGLRTAPSTTSPIIVAQAHFNLANSLATQLKWEDSEREYRAAIQANPSYANAYYGLAIMLDQLDRPKEALQLMYIVLQLNPNFPNAEKAARDILVKIGDKGG